ncbi:MAG: ATP-binding protein [Chloroflexota bacterium]
MAAALAVVARVAHRHELVALGSGIAHVLLTGPAGSGKTTLAAAITRVVRELAGQDVAVYTVPATTSGARWAELGAHLAERGRDPAPSRSSSSTRSTRSGSARVGAVSQASGPAAKSLPLLLAAIDGLQSGPPAVAAGLLDRHVGVASHPTDALAAGSARRRHRAGASPTRRSAWRSSSTRSGSSRSSPTRGRPSRGPAAGPATAPPPRSLSSGARRSRGRTRAGAGAAVSRPTCAAPSPARSVPTGP